MNDSLPRPRSHTLVDGANRSPARAMLRASGLKDDDFTKPLIGVANTWIEIGPCNYHLRELAQHVQDGIRAAGGTRWNSIPFRFPTASPWVREGMRASLISREVIADSIELVTRGNLFDALDRAGGMRQDHSRRRHGAGAAEYSGLDSLRRLDRSRDNLKDTP